MDEATQIYNHTTKIESQEIQEKRGESGEEAWFTCLEKGEKPKP